MTFRLLQLPQLVFTDIINELQPKELVYLSLCSQNMKTLVKPHKKIKFDVIVDTKKKQVLSIETAENDLPTIILSVRSPTITNVRPVGYVSINGQKVPFAILPKDEHVVTYWEDTNFGLENIVEYFLGLFGIKSIKKVHVSASSLWFLDWIHIKGISCDLCETEKRVDYTTEQLYAFLSKYESVNKFYFRIKREAFYRYEGPLPSYPTLILRADRWLTLDSLKTLNSQDFIVSHSWLDSEIMNKFVKHWLTGAMSRLQFMSIGRKSMDFERFADGFMDRLVEVHVQRKYMRHSGEEHTFGFSHDLTRDDGVVITIAGMVMEDGINYLWLMVWPDKMGRTHQQHLQGIEEN